MLVTTLCFRPVTEFNPEYLFIPLGVHTGDHCGFTSNSHHLVSWLNISHLFPPGWGQNQGMQRLRLACARAVGEQHAAAVGLKKAFLGLENIVLLLGEEEGKTFPDIVDGRK